MLAWQVLVVRVQRGQTEECEGMGAFGVKSVDVSSMMNELLHGTNFSFFLECELFICF